MIYEQFIVSIVELIMLSWQPILLYNFHNMRVTWLFYYLFKLQVHILPSLENISIFNIWKLWLVRCDVTFSGTSLILPKMSENFWSKEIPLWWLPDSTLKLNNSRMAWLIPAIYISFSSILNALSYEINLFSRCNSPLRNRKATKNPIVLKMWGWERVKVEGLVGKLSQNALFSNFSENCYNHGKRLVQKYVIKGIPTI